MNFSQAKKNKLAIINGSVQEEEEEFFDVSDDIESLKVELKSVSYENKTDYERGKTKSGEIELNHLNFLSNETLSISMGKKDEILNGELHSRGIFLELKLPYMRINLPFLNTENSFFNIKMVYLKNTNIDLNFRRILVNSEYFNFHFDKFKITTRNFHLYCKRDGSIRGA